MNSYQAAATAARLPALTAIDEASVEPSPRALSAFLAELPHPLTYPVARAEFGLFADASVRYGRQVAFLGADANDNSGDAQAFLAHHPVSYPSYQTHLDQMTGIVPQGLLGTPTTIFMNRAGRVVHVHTGQYESQGALDGDIRRYALGE